MRAFVALLPLPLLPLLPSNATGRVLVNGDGGSAF